MLDELRRRLEKEIDKVGATRVATLLGVSRGTIYNWIANGNVPLDKLAMLYVHGVDVMYIVTGEQSDGGIGESAVHQAVIDAVDLLSLDKKVDASQLAKAVVKLCAKSGATSTPPPQQHFEGGQQIFHQAPTGDIAARDIIKGKASKVK